MAKIFIVCVFAFVAFGCGRCIGRRGRLCRRWNVIFQDLQKDLHHGSTPLVVPLDFSRSVFQSEFDDIRMQCLGVFRSIWVGHFFVLWQMRKQIQTIISVVLTVVPAVVLVGFFLGLLFAVAGGSGFALGLFLLLLLRQDVLFRSRLELFSSLSTLGGRLGRSLLFLERPAFCFRHLGPFGWDDQSRRRFLVFFLFRGIGSAAGLRGCRRGCLHRHAVKLWSRGGSVLRSILLLHRKKRIRSKRASVIEPVE
mmetsp:Transcript_7122/g.17875  ORF Transcript_7122/g.17875 Transcript_7122/m.17875 type:complete len:252 (-) Transcript_7122:85-840(-)